MTLTSHAMGTSQSRCRCCSCCLPTAHAGETPQHHHARIKHILKKLEETPSDATTVVGFISSMDESLAANPRIINKMKEGYQALEKYLKESGIQSDIQHILNANFADNRAILEVIEKTTIGKEDRRDAVLSDMSVKDFTKKFSLEEAGRYVKVSECRQ